MERAIARLGEDLRRALAAMSDSPAFVDGRFVSTGAFHEVGPAASLDALTVALLSKSARAEMGVVPQLDNLDTTLTVRQNLVVFAFLYRVPRTERRRWTGRGWIG